MSNIEFHPEKLTVAQLKRQLLLLGCEVDKKVKFKQEELLSALSVAIDGRKLNAVEVSKEMLKEEKALKNLKFKAGDVYVCFADNNEGTLGKPENVEEKPAKEVKKPKIVAYYGIHKVPVVEIAEYEHLGKPHMRIYCGDGTSYVFETKDKGLYLKTKSE